MVSLAVAGCGNGDLVGGAISGSGSPVTPSTANRAPSINGVPPSTVRVNELYDFRPNAFDPDGDTLRFQITGKPGWASFESNTGRLYGTPPTGSFGTFGGVLITASDGKAEATLPAFSIVVIETAPATGSGSAALSWTRPTQYDDGKPLNDLAGYRIYYGTSPSALNTVQQVSDPAATGATILPLSSGTWYFSISSFNSTGVESVKAGPVSVTIS